MSKQNTFKFSPSIISKAISMGLLMLGVSLANSATINAEETAVETKLHAHHHGNDGHKTEHEHHHEDATIKDDHHHHEK